jgi:hypothetical protein
MNKLWKNVGLSLSAALLTGAQLSVLVAVVASQIGERAVRGAKGFAVYRDLLTEQA